MRISLTANGRVCELDVDPRRLLVEVVREDLRLPGTHIGCMTGDCGACTLELDGEVVKSCMVLAVATDGRSVRTIEGFAEGDELDPIQQAFWDEHGFQCGFCLPGMLFAARDLLRREPNPDEQAIRTAINGNLCRCTGYEPIVRSIQRAAEELRQPSS
jgi:carbon-monoxide dehydrogenase small subunit